MNPNLAFNRYRARGLWWMVDPEFEHSLSQIGFGQRDLTAEWLDLGQPRPRSSDNTGRGVTAVIDLPGVPERLHLRRTLHGGLLAPLWRGHLAGVNRVRREIEVTARLFRRGAPVPRPILALAMRSGPLWRASVATVHLSETRTALQWLSSEPNQESHLRGARAIGSAVGRFHAAGGRHADLHAGNILLRTQPTEIRAWVIDLDKARIGPNSSSRHSAELKRLSHSLKKRGLLEALGPEGREAFCESYRQAQQKG